MSIKSKTAAIAVSAALAIPGAVAFATTASAAPGDAVVTSVRIHEATRWTTGSTNVRSGPGTNYRVIKTLRAGTKVTTVATQKGWSSDLGRNVNWSKISTGGWVRSDLLTSTNPGGATLNNTGGNVLYWVRTKGSTNVRSGPGTNYRVTRTLSAGSRQAVVDQKWGWSSELGDNVMWEKLASGGWVRGDLTVLS